MGGGASRGDWTPRSHPRGRGADRQGRVSIVIAGIGVTAGIEPELGPLAAAYVLLLAIAGPIAARFADSVRSTRATATV
jgi:hypothetical protein